ncbi:MAG: hypothetical protein U9R25_15745 [Chloroflexota bacterium]|nr:hypothetical protein [Chloroflexota bacterium]
MKAQARPGLRLLDSVNFRYNPVLIGSVKLFQESDGHVWDGQVEETM